MEHGKKKRLRLRKWVIIGIFAFVGFGMLNFDQYFEVSKNLDIYSTLLRELNIYYVEETQPGELVKTSMDAMLETLDPYTVYIPESSIEDYRFMVSGEYGGIGALISKDGERIMITEPYKGFPADKAALKAGDYIMEVEGESTEGKSTNDIGKMLKGQAGTKVNLKVDRNGQIMDKTLTRKEIKIPDVPYHGFVAEETGYVKLNSFTRTASSEVRKAYQELETKGMKKFILDLRGNGGGLLRESVNIVNMFVPRGQVVVNTKGRVEKWNRKHKTLNEPVDPDIPVVVLVDGGSASASEIVSGSLQDLDRAVIIGEQTYGKGLVQQTRDLSYNSKLKVTVAKYHTPSGRCIQKLDYSSRNQQGNAAEVPDSLITHFKTKNGRKVLDGRGVDPDVLVDRGVYSHIALALAAKHIIFHYATDYTRNRDTIAAPGNFVVTDEEYARFKEYVLGKELTYSTGTEDLLKKLKKTAESEKYLADAKMEFEALKAKLTPDKQEDLERFKQEISDLLESEIVTRYYYANGRIKHLLNKDPFIKEAITLLNDDARYKGILDGTIHNQ